MLALRVADVSGAAVWHHSQQLVKSTDCPLASAPTATQNNLAVRAEADDLKDFLADVDADRGQRAV